MHARVQSARSLFFLFVTRTGTPTHPSSFLSLSSLFPPFHCRSRAHFLPRGPGARRRRAQSKKGNE